MAFSHGVVRETAGSDGPPILLNPCTSQWLPLLCCFQSSSFSHPPFFAIVDLGD